MGGSQQFPTQHLPPNKIPMNNYYKQNPASMLVPPPNYSNQNTAGTYTDQFGKVNPMLTSKKSNSFNNYGQTSGGQNANASIGQTRKPSQKENYQESARPKFARNMSSGQSNYQDLGFKENINKNMEQLKNWPMAAMATNSSMPLNYGQEQMTSGYQMNQQALFKKSPSEQASNSSSYMPLNNIINSGQKMVSQCFRFYLMRINMN